MKKLSTLEKAFDTLSGIPYLKRITKGMWWFQVFLTPAVTLFGLFNKGLGLFEEPATLRMLICYLFGVTVFGYMFHRWDKRDRERTSSF